MFRTGESNPAPKEILLSFNHSTNKAWEPCILTDRRVRITVKNKRENKSIHMMF